jgi:hypothetical protein
MPKHTTESILPSGGLPARTSNQFSRYIETVSTGEPASCLCTEQVYQNSAFSARGRRINGYQLKADAVISAVPPFLRSPKGGGFLETF